MIEYVNVDGQGANITVHLKIQEMVGLCHVILSNKLIRNMVKLEIAQGLNDILIFFIN